MKVSAIGLEAIKQREGVRLKAYRDSVGVPTIGWGHTAGVVMGQTITRAQAEAFLAQDIDSHVAPAFAAVKKPMLQHEADAFASIVFNIGVGGFRGSSFLKAFNRGDKAGCAKAIMNWTKPKEVTSRRQAERDQFQTPYETALPKARSTDRAPVRVASQPLKTKPIVSQNPAPVTGKPALVTPTAQPPSGVFGRLRAIFGGSSAVPAIKATKGDPIVYGVQEQLKAKGYYQTGELDGIDGRKTRDAVSSIRKDNGLGDGGMDDEFMKRLPGFPQAPVSKERAGASLAHATAARPEVFEAPKNLTVGGIAIGGLSSLLGIGGEALTRAKETADKAGDAIDTAQAILAPILSVVTWCLAHPWLVMGGIAAWFVLKGLTPWIGLWIQWRQGRL